MKITQPNIMQQEGNKIHKTEFLPQYIKEENLLSIYSFSVKNLMALNIVKYIRSYQYKYKSVENLHSCVKEERDIFHRNETYKCTSPTL
jgi:hypothetical protein